jgi:hypothetical protein
MRSASADGGFAIQEGMAKLVDTLTLIRRAAEAVANRLFAA